MGSASSLHEALEQLIGEGLDGLESEPEWPPLFMELWVLATREAQARTMVSEAMRECRDLMAKLLAVGKTAGLVRRDLNVQATATLITALFDGIELHWVVDQEHVDLRQLQKPAAEMIERFIVGGPNAEMEQSQGGISDLLGQLGNSPDTSRSK